jgi:hypothetical protein
MGTQGSTDAAPTEAFRLISKQQLIIITQGYAVAQSNLGVCLQHDNGVHVDLRGAAQYYKLGADQEFAVGQLIRESVCRIVRVFRLIYQEQRIILNSQHIKELLVLKTVMEFVCGMAKVFRLSCQEQALSQTWRRSRNYHGSSQLWNSPA